MTTGPTTTIPNRRPRAAILLEVLLALSLAFTAGAVILGSLSSAVGALRRVRLEAQGADLAVTLFSEIQMGLVSVEDASTQPFEDEALADWTWQVVVTPFTTADEAIELSRVEVVVRHGPSGFVYRVAQLFDQSAASPTELARRTAAPAGGGP